MRNKPTKYVMTASHRAAIAKGKQAAARKRQQEALASIVDTHMNSNNKKKSPYQIAIAILEATDIYVAELNKLVN